MVDISTVNGIINQLITRGHHLVHILFNKKNILWYTMIWYAIVALIAILVVLIYVYTLIGYFSMGTPSDGKDHGWLHQQNLWNTWDISWGISGKSIRLNPLMDYDVWDLTSQDWLIYCGWISCLDISCNHCRYDLWLYYYFSCVINTVNHWYT